MYLEEDWIVLTVIIQPANNKRYSITSRDLKLRYARENVAMQHYICQTKETLHVPLHSYPTKPPERISKINNGLSSSSQNQSFTHIYIYILILPSYLEED